MLIDVVDLPDHQLVKSQTYLKYNEKVGVCPKCQEPTSILNPCCSEYAHFEGGTLDSNYLWDQIESELKTLAEPDYDAEAKDREIHNEK